MIRNFATSLRPQGQQYRTSPCTGTVPRPTHLSRPNNQLYIIGARTSLRDIGRVWKHLISKFVVFVSFRRREHDNRPFSHACMPVMPSHCSNVGPPIIPKSVFNSMHVAIRETFALMLVFNIPSMGARHYLESAFDHHIKEGRNDRVQKRQNPNHTRHDRDDAAPEIGKGMPPRKPSAQ